MPTHIALLRAINVGGTGKLPMADLRALCEQLGFSDVRTYIQTGNIIFSSQLSATKAKALLEDALEERLGRRHAVVFRTPAALEKLERENPFPDADPKRVLVVFLERRAAADALKDWPIPGGEQLVLAGHEIYVYFPEGMGQSKLKVPLADKGTGRNLNTVRALIGLAKE